MAAPFWRQPRPDQPARRLSPAKRALAARLAAQADRPYPNLVDNARAARSTRSALLAQLRDRA